VVQNHQAVLIIAAEQTSEDDDWLPGNDRIWLGVDRDAMRSPEREPLSGMRAGARRSEHGKAGER
jgi:hypothetical protein